MVVTTLGKEFYILACEFCCTLFASVAALRKPMADVDTSVKLKWFCHSRQAQQQ